MANDVWGRAIVILSLPSPGVIETLRRHRVVECGAGAGLWLHVLHAAGIDAIGYDPLPRGSGVMKGDHRRLADHADRLLLIVWPPDGTNTQEWVDAWGGEWLAVCGANRFDWPRMDVEHEERLPMYDKNGSIFKYGRVGGALS